MHLSAGPLTNIADVLPIAIDFPSQQEVSF